MESSQIAGGNVKCSSLCGNSLVTPQKVKHRITTWPCNSTLQYITKESKTGSQTSVKVHTCSEQYYSQQQNVETAQMPINWWMDKQNMACEYNGISFSHKKKWRTGTCYNMDVCSNIFRMPDTKFHIALIPFMWNNQNKQTHRDRKLLVVCQGQTLGRAVRNGESCLIGRGFTLDW